MNDPLVAWEPIRRRIRDFIRRDERREHIRHRLTIAAIWIGWALAIVAWTCAATRSLQ